MPISVTRISPTTTPHPMRRAGDMVVEQAAPATTTSAALTATEPALRAMPASLRSARPDPAFIAHLIATAEQMPQTRVLRRAEAADGTAVYQAASAYAPASRMSRFA